MRETNIDIRGGHSQVNPAATQAVVPANRYTPIIVQGYPARKYDNRIIVVAAPLQAVSLHEGRCGERRPDPTRI